MDWNNFFMPGTNQNYNFVPGAYPPSGGGGGAMYQNGQQNWQYYPSYNQNYISEASTLQPIVSPLVSSSPYGGVFPHPSGEYQEGNMGSGMVSTFQGSGMRVNESLNTPADALASILSASSLTPTAGEFIPRSKNVQKLEEHANVSGSYSNLSNSVPQPQHQSDMPGVVGESVRNVGGVDAKNFEAENSNINKFKADHSSNNKSIPQRKDNFIPNSKIMDHVMEAGDTCAGNDGSPYRAADSKDSSSNSANVKLNVQLIPNDVNEKVSGVVGEQKNHRQNNRQALDMSVRKGSGRILQNRMGDNVRSNMRDSKNQGRQQLLAEAATYYSSKFAESRQVDGVNTSSYGNKSFDWKAHREGRNSNSEAVSYIGKHNSQTGNGRERVSQEFENSSEDNTPGKEKNSNGGQFQNHQNGSNKSDRGDQNERRVRDRNDRKEKGDKVEREDVMDRGERNDRGDRKDRGDWNDKGDGKDRMERNDRRDRNDRGNRNDREERNDRGDRNDREHRNDRRDGNNRGGRNDWGERFHRNERGGRFDKKEKNEGRERSDRGDRNDKGERNNRERWGDVTEWNERGKKWDRNEKRDRNDNGDMNERGIRSDREIKNNQNGRIGRQEGAERSDRNDGGRYQKTFYSSRFNSRNSNASPGGRDIPSESGSYFQNRARWQGPNQSPNDQQMEVENGFSSRYESSSGYKSGSFVPSESTFRNGGNSFYKNDNIEVQNSLRNFSEESTLAKSHEDTKRNGKSSQNPGLRTKKSFYSQPQYADDEASQRESLSDQLSRGTLECLVCCERVRQNDAVWSCRNCYHVLHLRCIKKWARSSKAESGWRCPACQNVSSKMPQEYFCFCGKMVDPEWNRQDLPHSCGEVCGRTRAARAPELGPCVHRCTLLCHPGPCPPCLAQVNRECGCGKTSQIVSCGSSQPLLCEATCDKLLNCKVHRCTKTCHWGACGDCDIVIKQDCFCTKNSQEVPCTEETANVKNYSCKEVCDKKLSCNNHNCTLICHSGDCVLCELMPVRVTHCPCGKTALGEDCKRVSCLDPVPTCGQICEKQLPCGQPGNYHQCQAECHAGPCPQCPLITFVKCRCGHMDREIECKDLKTKADDARCEKRCSKKRACGKHKCNQTCCIDVDHQCPLPCNHTLSCGQHRCEELCHRGHCQPCWRTSFEELFCECGASVIFPPVPCGTRRPACTEPCSRQHPCDHEALHKCHSEPTCPPCTVLMERYCYGKHELRKAVPCHQTEFSCGMPCGLPLPCGRHTCILPCHKGSCVREGQPVCTQPCKTTRTLCGHPCAAPCHEGPCPDTPCKETVRVTCVCGHRSTTRPCYDQTKEYRRVMTALLASRMQDVQLGHSVDIDDLGGPSARVDSLKTLECNDECKIIERNRRLAIGLQIRNPDLSSKLQPRYSDFMRQWGKKDPYFVSMVHDKLTELVQLAKQSKQKSRSYSFSSMNRDKRHFIHEYCEHFGCESQAYDPEPNRNVVATAQRDRAWLPSMSLLEVLQRESGQRKVPKPVTARALDSKLKELPLGQSTSQEKSGEGSSKTEKEKEKEVEIDYFDYNP